MEKYNTSFPDKTKSAVSITLKENNIIVENQNDVANIFSNFSLVCIFAVLSKIFEKIMSKQLSNFFKNILSKFQCGFRKGYSTQHCLLIILEKWKHSIIMKLSELSQQIEFAFNCEVAFLWFIIKISKISKRLFI